jgi:hypothetical protein
MVRVGSTGCGFEQPLASMRAALDANPANAGFVRPDATLAVILLMDEDDCSARDAFLFAPDDFRCTRFGVTCLDGGNTLDEMAAPGVKDRCVPNVSASGLLDDPAVFRDFLVGLKGDPRRVVVGGIFGDPSPFEVVLVSPAPGQPEQSSLAPSCRFAGPDGLPDTDDDQAAAPAVRLQAFTDLFGDRGTAASVCQNDLSGPLEQIGDRIAFAMGTPCITQSLGAEPTCIVEDVLGEVVTEIAQCPGASTCWSLIEDPVACPVLDHLKLEITRDVPPDPATITRARCAI